MANDADIKKSSPLLIAVAWAVVVLPTAWGLNYTIQNALKIFGKPATTVSGGGSQAR